MKKLEVLVFILLVVGGINWGVWSIFEFNVIDYIFGHTWIDRVIYFLMGVSGVYAVFNWKCSCSRKK
jgi:uncharacterized membrane protein YuzA (DUF378 family)